MTGARGAARNRAVGSVALPERVPELLDRAVRRVDRADRDAGEHADARELRVTEAGTLRDVHPEGLRELDVPDVRVESCDELVAVGDDAHSVVVGIVPELDVDHAASTAREQTHSTLVTRVVDALHRRVPVEELHCCLGVRREIRHHTAGRLH